MSEALAADFLTSRAWKFYHKDGPVASEAFRLLPDGRIGGYRHPNERGWRVEAGALCLISDSGEVTSRLVAVPPASGQEGRAVFAGPYLPNPQIILCLSEQTQREVLLRATRGALQGQIRNQGWEIGDHSYGEPVFFEEGLAKLRVGKFTSIADGVVISFGDHRMDGVSTYPFVALRHKWPSAPQGVPDHTTKGDVVIGNDVWIGAGAFIGSGVTIGDGAVIAARAVVTRNVPPYAVAAGLPARIIRRRFSPAIIARLLALRWWDWPDDKVDRFIPLMLSPDIEAFLAAAEAA